jgi:hypothetical protein
MNEEKSLKPKDITELLCICIWFPSHSSWSSICFFILFFLLVDRRNEKVIINSHTQVEESGFKPRSWCLA